MSSEAPEIRQKRRKEERPDEILAAALKVFTRDGFAGTRLEDIAELAGCTKGTIYVYFDSKEALFRAVVGKMIAPSFRKVDSILNDETLDVPTRLKRFLTGAYREILESPQQVTLVQLLIAEGHRFPDLVDAYRLEIGNIGFARMKATLEQGIARGEIRPIDTDTTTLVIFSAMTAESVRRMLDANRHRPIDIEVLAATHIDILLNGLLPDTSGQKRNKR